MAKRTATATPAQQLVEALRALEKEARGKWVKTNNPPVLLQLRARADALKEARELAERLLDGDAG